MRATPATICCGWLVAWRGRRRRGARPSRPGPQVLRFRRCLGSPWACRAGAPWRQGSVRGPFGQRRRGGPADPARTPRDSSRTAGSSARTASNSARTANSSARTAGSAPPVRGRRCFDSGVAWDRRGGAGRGGRGGRVACGARSGKGGGEVQPIRREHLAIRRALLVVRRALLAVRRALLAVRRALLTVRRALLTVRRALLAVRRALLTVRRALLAIRRAFRPVRAAGAAARGGGRADFSGVAAAGAGGAVLGGAGLPGVAAARCFSFRRVGRGPMLGADRPTPRDGPSLGRRGGAADQ